MFEWDIEGNELNRWKSLRINDLGITPDGELLVAVCRCGIGRGPVSVFGKTAASI